MNYPAIIYPAKEGGYVAEVLALPGCIAQGENMEECLLELEIVTNLWLETFDNKQNIISSEKAIDNIIQFNRDYRHSIL